MPVDLVTLRSALARALPDGGPITGVRPLTTGFSNETYLLEGRELILRLPPAAGSMLDGHDVIMQARIYQAIGKRAGAPPVPRIVHLCEDAAIIGTPFYVMERVGGEAVHDIELQPWFTEASDGLRARMCRAWVETFAGLANQKPLAVLGAARAPSECMRTWRAFAARAACPTLVAAIDRLLACPAPVSGPASLVHGDPKLSNLMWRDGAISAVLDWEMSLNGEPLSDLGYMLYGFESAHHGATRAQKLAGMLSRDQVVALWSDISGRSAEGIAWHETAQIAKISAIIAEGANMYATGASTDPKLAYFKQNLDYYLGVLDAMLCAAGL